MAPSKNAMRWSVKLDDLPARELTREEMKGVSGARGLVAGFGDRKKDTAKTQTLDPKTGEVKYDDPDDGRDNGLHLKLGF